MKLAAKIVVSLTLIFLLVRNMNLDGVASTINDADVSLLFAALCFYLCATIFELLKLYSLLFPTIRFVQIFKMVYVGLYFNNLLPTNVGGDAYKVFALQKAIPFDRALALTLFDRLFGLMTLVFWFIVYLVVFPNFINLTQENISIAPNTKTALLAVGFIVALIGCTLVLVPKTRQVIVFRFAKKIAVLLLVFKTLSRTRYALQFLLSTCYHLSRLFAFYFLIYSFGGNINWFDIVPVLALIAISSMLPISFGGLGIREGVMVSTLLVVGVDYDVAISVAAANLLVLWSKSAVGLCVFITCGTKKGFEKQQHEDR